MEQDLEIFHTNYASNLKKAMLANNVIDEYFFAVPLLQVCIPGLHLTLGIYMKMFTLLENYTRELDTMIVVFLAGKDKVVDDDEFRHYVQSIKNIFALESGILELEESCEILQNEIDWSAMVENNMHEKEENKGLIDEKQKEISEKKDILSGMSQQNVKSVGGPCQSSLDITLKSMNIERQPYHGICFVGNQCHTLLKNTNIEKLCKSVPAVVFGQVGEGPIYEESISKCDMFITLFTLYSKCHLIFNSDDMLSNNVISALETDIQSFMLFFRDNWPDVRITPKVHILEDHVIPFLEIWHVGCGFYGEQGGESLHAIFNKKKAQYHTIKNDCARLTYLMKEYLSSTNPKARSIRVMHTRRSRRDLKRKCEDV